MSLTDVMRFVDLVIRRPDELTRAPEHGASAAALAGTIDRERLQAVHRAHAELVLARWWEPRFAATVATLAHLLGGRLAAARLLFRSEAFDAAVGEDETGAALVGAALDALAAGALSGGAAPAPEWLPELLAYEYLLAVGLPRRARGEAVDAALEARLLPSSACWLAGGRLARPVLVCPFAWPVADLEEEPHDAEPDPHVRVLFTAADEVVDAAPPDVVADVMTLLAEGASDEAVSAALGEELSPEAAPALAWLRDVGLLGDEERMA